MGARRLEARGGGDRVVEVRPPGTWSAPFIRTVTQAPGAAARTAATTSAPKRARAAASSPP